MPTAATVLAVLTVSTHCILITPLTIPVRVTAPSKIVILVMPMEHHALVVLPISQALTIFVLIVLFKIVFNVVKTPVVHNAPMPILFSLTQLVIRQLVSAAVTSIVILVQLLMFAPAAILDSPLSMLPLTRMLPVFSVVWQDVPLALRLISVAAALMVLSIQSLDSVSYLAL